MGARDSGTTHLEFKIPARGIMGYRSEFLTDTNGNGIMNHVFDGYEPYKGDIQQRSTGSIVVHETGESTAYGLFYAQDRGRLFIGPGVPVYEGMIVGSNPKGDVVALRGGASFGRFRRARQPRFAYHFRIINRLF